MNGLELFLDHEFVRRALYAGLAVSVLCAIIGVYVVLRGLSMIGDGLAHVSLAGVALGLVVGFYPFAVALAAAIVGALVIQMLRTRQVVRGDTAIGIIFTAGLAIGVILISTGKGPGFNLSGYLFGSLLGVGPTDLWVILGVATVLLAIFALLHKEFLYVTFSEEAARLSGLPMGFLNVAFTIVTASTIVVASRIVGVLLVSALLIIPAATGLQFARSFRTALVFSVIAGALSVVAGIAAAVSWGTPPGASIALASTVVFTLAIAGKAVIARAGSPAA